jgi:hypothetical protein
VRDGGRTIFIADAHRGDRKRFVVRTDEKLTAFLELEAFDRRCVAFEVSSPVGLICGSVRV